MLGKDEKLIHPDSECSGLIGSNKKKREIAYYEDLQMDLKTFVYSSYDIKNLMKFDGKHISFFVK